MVMQRLPLSRSAPRLPNSYFWTWDHSANWVLDDPGGSNFGCYNRYLKRPETFIQDYERLVDLAAALGVRGIVIWGFLRDSHGGIEAAKRVADYAAARGVTILPGVGTTWYGGFYYEGEHPYNIETFLKKHPEATLKNEKGDTEIYRDAVGVCPSHPAFRDWLAEGMRWLFREFAVGGVNLENGDFVVCHCPRCRQAAARWPGDDPDYLRLQAMSYQPALEAVADQLDKSLGTYATYSGFIPGRAPGLTPGQRVTENTTELVPYLNCDHPAMFDRIPAQGIGQWTLTRMLRAEPLPLTAFLDDGAPSAVFDNPRWPAGVRPPSRRSTGFLHQGSQWFGGRYQSILGSIKEACLLADRAGLEGLCIHGEVSSRYTGWALNYLAFSHFIHRPEDTLRQFGRQTLGAVLGGEEAGESFIEILARGQAGTVTEADRKQIDDRYKECREQAFGSQEALEQLRYWEWLSHAVRASGQPGPILFS